MSIPECHLVRDLLVPYLAGEVSPETIAFMNGHLDRCPDCRAALAALTGDAPAPVTPPAAPSPDPGRKLVGRVRKQVILLIAVVVTSLALAVGGLVWGISAFQRAVNDPTRHPVPAYSTAPATAAKVDLSPLGLTPDGVDQIADGAVAHFRTSTGQPVTLAFYLHASPNRAKRAYDDWKSGFHTKVTSVAFESGSVGSTRFLSGGHYYQGWHDGSWFVTVDVPDTVPQAAELRAEILQQLGAAWLR